ncbi:MAG: alpha/beta hydrolase [Clostridiales bacterium]|nr:alpha/beta hydrolase [Clostridiales bacterium]
MAIYEFKSTDGQSTVKYRIWEAKGETKAILQIIHGMSEHIARYDPFASWLAENGITVVGDDHIGHGMSSDPADYGYFGEKDGHKRLVDDEEELRLIMRAKYPGAPYFMLGHSMGSFMLRAWLALYGAKSDIAGAIVMGTCGPNKMLPAGIFLAKTLKLLKGGRAKSKLLSDLTLGPYRKPFTGEASSNAWLSTVPEVSADYDADPMSGFPFTIGGYVDLFALINFVTSEGWYGMVPKDIDLLVCSGKEDPVGDFGKGPELTAEKLREAGCSVELKLYEGMRHEVLGEASKGEVWKDMMNFIKSHPGSEGAWLI